ncbi:MAG: DUF1501 domain-containing protein [Planctomycetaceae bacterium]|nr:DUF1501 domain-containing protein [Planctomycetaceae bacterium]
MESLFSRRDALKVGALTVSGQLLPEFTDRLTAAAVESGTADSVIYLWMGGGVPHLDSFDPKPDAPETIRGTLTDIATNTPGIRFNETCPNLAKITDELAVLRTFSHDSNDHLLSQVYTLSGRKVTKAQLFTEPNIGSIVNYLHGPRNGLPGYIAVPGITRPGPPPHNLFVGGWLGNQYAPFCLGGQPDNPDFTTGKVVENPSPIAEEDLNPKELSFLEDLSGTRLSKRARLREQLETTLRDAEKRQEFETIEGNYSSALNLLLSEKVRSAFDLSIESNATRERYGKTKLGGRCLMARRLVEAGARFVMVDYGYDHDYGNLWDNHNAASQNFPHTSELCKRGYHVAGMDKAFAALIGDMRERGLLDRTLIVFLTEFGRTPKINGNGGRDHWGMCGSLFFAGAGVKGGQVIGESDKEGAYPVTRGYSPADIAATIYHSLGISIEGRLPDMLGRPHPVLDHGQPIAEVFA